MDINVKNFKKANQCFRAGNYEGAINLYRQIVVGQSVLSKYAEFNLKLLSIRFSKAGFEGLNDLDNLSEGVNNKALVPHKTAQKPDYLDDYSFKCVVKSNLFDGLWYLNKYSNLYHIGDDPLEHYLINSIELGTNPSEYFDTSYYIQANPDVIESGLHPFLHYVCQGCNENRVCLPPPPPEYISSYSVSKVEYVSRISVEIPLVQKTVRVIAHYLPQFHAIPENDGWWGKGFTEWTNTKPAKPQFKEHYQPHEPEEFIGYYDLLEPSTQRNQVELAKQYGVEGFCFYLYWFSGHRLLEQPLDNYLKDSSLDLPFCVCWANENWSRRWDGLENDLLMEQNYSDDDDISFIKNIAKYLRDKRYIRINNRPLLLIYRPNLFPDMKATARRWRMWCKDNGIGEIYLTYPQSFECVDPDVYGFDAACEFPPNNSAPPNITHKVEDKNNDFQGVVYDWRILLERSDSYKSSPYPLFRSTTPSWDNTARKKNKGVIFENSCPVLFEKWLINAFSDTLYNQINRDEQIVFVNAWNEWAEGAHLEPDRKYGYAWLQAIRNAHELLGAVKKKKILILIHAFYMDVFIDIIERLSRWHIINFEIVVTVNKINYVFASDVLNRFKLNANIVQVDNVGRDIYPFFEAMNNIDVLQFDFVLKLHTKKSKHRVDGDAWRNEIFDSLANEAVILSRLAFFDKGKLGILSPSNQHVPLSYYWGSNESNVKKLCKKIGIPLDFLQNDLSFVAGTMFLIDSNVLSYVLKLGLSIKDFPDESGQVDGTIMHAVERLFGVVCAWLNKDIVSVNGGLNLDFKYAVPG